MSFYLRRYFFEKTGGKEHDKLLQRQIPFDVSARRPGVKRCQRYHHGIDLVGLDDTTVYSIADGKVRTGSDNSAGNYVCVTIEDGRRMYYFHLKSFKVKTGDVIKKGQAVGIMGNTGHSFGAHTHLELRVKGTAYKSLDISAFTGIPNKVGIYEYKEDGGMKQNKYSYDDTVDAMIRDGVTDVKNMQNWEKMLDGREKLETKYVREIFKRYHEKLSR